MSLTHFEYTQIIRRPNRHEGWRGSVISPDNRATVQPLSERGGGGVVLSLLTTVQPFSSGDTEISSRSCYGISCWRTYIIPGLLRDIIPGLLRDIIPGLLRDSTERQGDTEAGRRGEGARRRIWIGRRIAGLAHCAHCTLRARDVPSSQRVPAPATPFGPGARLARLARLA